MSYIDNYVTKSGGEIVITSMISNLESKFPAYITSFADNMSSAWNEEQVYGRPDPIGNYQSTKRSISLAFDVPAENAVNALKYLKEIQKVKQMMYPAYSKTATTKEGVEVTQNALSLAKAPLVRIKMGNLIRNEKGEGLLGWISSFSATPVIEMGMFNTSPGVFYPKVHQVSIEFTPQHEYDLGFDDKKGPLNGTFPTFPYGA